MAEFNLLDEDWIEAFGPNGEQWAGGIVDTLKRAHELSAVVDHQSPLFQFGVYRMLVAFVADAFSGAYETVGEFVEAGSFTEDRIDEYSERWRDRFFLFGGEHPFYQVHPERDERKSVSELFHDLPSGTNVTFFHHEPAGGVPAGACARALCALPCFSTVGGKGFTAGLNGTPPWYFLLKGENLFETLVLNLPGLEVAVGDAPAWRADNPAHDSIRQEDGVVLKALTWVPRKVKLLPCSHGGERSEILVEEIQYESRKKPNLKFVDPNVARVFEKLLVPAQSGGPNDPWNEVGWLIRAAGGEPGPVERGGKRYTVPPAFERLEHARAIECYGLASNKKKCVRWYQAEYLCAPLSDEERAAFVGALGSFDEVVKTIRDGLASKYPSLFQRVGELADRVAPWIFEGGVTDERWMDRLREWAEGTVREVAALCSPRDGVAFEKEMEKKVEEKLKELKANGARGTGD
ncbi:MAG: type I-E CRISPR-associated protein Cse1/CasA [Promethearchaeota archaeon]